MNQQETQERIDALSEENPRLAGAVDHLIKSEHPEARSLGRHVLTFNEKVESYKQSGATLNDERRAAPHVPVDQLESYNSHRGYKSAVVRHVRTMEGWMDYADIDHSFEPDLQMTAPMKRVVDDERSGVLERETLAADHERDLKEIAKNWPDMMSELTPHLRENDLDTSVGREWEFGARERGYTESPDLEDRLGLVHDDDFISFGDDSRG